MDLSIIIVNWNSVSFLRKCLKSIYANGEGLEIEILVLDNASWDGCEKIIATDFPAVEFVQLGANVGFAAANNLGVKHCCGRNLLFLNPDTQIVGSALQELVSFLDATPAVGVAGPKLLNSDLTVQTSCIQRFPSILNQTLDSEFLRRRFTDSPFWGVAPLLEVQSSPVPVEVIVGACLMIKAEMFERIGGFNPKYFMYAEDADLCFTAHQHGLKNYYVPSASVIHHGGCSSGIQKESHFSTIVMRESVFRFLCSKRGLVYGTCFRWVSAVAALSRIGLLSILIPFNKQPRRTVYTTALWKWVKLLRWATGLEQWASNL